MPHSHRHFWQRHDDSSVSPALSPAVSRGGSPVPPSPGAFPSLPPLPRNPRLGVRRPAQRDEAPDLAMLFALLQRAREPHGWVDTAVCVLNGCDPAALSDDVPPLALSKAPQHHVTVEDEASADRPSRADVLVREKTERPVLHAYCRMVTGRWLRELRLDPEDGAGLTSTTRLSRDYFVMRAALPWRCDVEHHGVLSREPLWITRAEDVPKLRANPLTDAVQVGLSLRGFLGAWLATHHRAATPLRVKTFTEAGRSGSVLEWAFFATPDTELVLCGLFAEVFPADYQGPSQNARRAIIYAIESTEVRDSRAVWPIGADDDGSIGSPGRRYDKPKTQTPSRALLVAYVDWLGVRYGMDHSAHLWVDPPTEADPPLLFKGTQRSAYTTQPELYQWYTQLFTSYGFPCGSSAIELVAPRLVLPQFSAELDVKHSGYVDDPRFHQTGNFGAMADELQRRADAAMATLQREVEDVNAMLQRWTLVVQPRYGAVGIGRSVAETTRSSLRAPRKRERAALPAADTTDAPAIGDISAADRGSFGLAIGSLVAPVLRLPFPTDDSATFKASSAALLHAAGGEGEDGCA
jgi:hypothetical protein